MKKKFKILSIDGGGIRGLYPATILKELEARIQEEKGEGTQLYEYFDLICGTSTGGIIALAISLGMKASDIQSLYYEYAGEIFGRKRGFWKSIFKSKYSTESLEKLLVQKFGSITSDDITRLGHAKTRVCIPTFWGETGSCQLLKTSHHENLVNDYKIPAVQVALATSAAPTYFKPSVFDYSDLSGGNCHEINKIDGGIFSNNPTLLGILEGTHCLDIPIEDIAVLSLGTGMNEFQETEIRKGYGLKYWMSPKTTRLMDVIFQAQSRHIEDLVCILQKGVTKKTEDKFLYHRIQHSFKTAKESIALDEVDPAKLKRLETAARDVVKHNGTQIISDFFSYKAEEFIPNHKL